jgi:cell wall-associated NlpC family hydrolase
MGWLRTIVICTAVCFVPFTLADAVGRPPAAGPAARAAVAARGEIGAPFAWGGTSPQTGFDSSGLVVWAYAQAGIRQLPHVAPALWSAGRHVPRSQLRPGDLVFFYAASHVGIYLGHGEFVHAPHTGAGVAVARLGGSLLKHYTGAVRIRG